jgi:hypothetical protein
MFSLFIKTHLEAQESVIVLESHILDNMMFWPQMSYY